MKKEIRIEKSLLGCVKKSNMFSISLNMVVFIISSKKIPFCLEEDNSNIFWKQAENKNADDEMYRERIERINVRIAFISDNLLLLLILNCNSLIKESIWF